MSPCLLLPPASLKGDSSSGWLSASLVGKRSSLSSDKLDFMFFWMHLHLLEWVVPGVHSSTWLCSSV